jgi:uncharacterized membrane protein
MNQVESIIVYRNPLEKMLWEGFMGGQFFPAIAAVVTFFIVLLITFNLLNRFRPQKRWNSPVNGYTAMGVAAVAAVAVGWVFWI